MSSKELRARQREGFQNMRCKDARQCCLSCGNKVQTQAGYFSVASAIRSGASNLSVVRSNDSNSAGLSRTSTRRNRLFPCPRSSRTRRSWFSNTFVILDGSFRAVVHWDSARAGAVGNLNHVLLRNSVPALIYTLLTCTSGWLRCAHYDRVTTKRAVLKIATLLSL